MLHEHQSASNKLRDRKARFEMKLAEAQRIVAEFRTKERMNEAAMYLEILNELKVRVDEFIEEVSNIFCMAL